MTQPKPVFPISAEAYRSLDEEEKKLEASLQDSYQVFREESGPGRDDAGLRPQNAAVEARLAQIRLVKKVASIVDVSTLPPLSTGLKYGDVVTLADDYGRQMNVILALNEFENPIYDDDLPFPTTDMGPIGESLMTGEDKVDIDYTFTAIIRDDFGKMTGSIAYKVTAINGRTTPEPTSSAN